MEGRREGWVGGCMCRKQSDERAVSPCHGPGSLLAVRRTGESCCLVPALRATSLEEERQGSQDC